MDARLVLKGSKGGCVVWAGLAGAVGAPRLRPEKRSVGGCCWDWVGILVMGCTGCEELKAAKRSCVVFWGWGAADGSGLEDPRFKRSVVGALC